MIPNEKKQIISNSFVSNALVALCIVGTLLLIGWLLRYSAYGLDFTDESFYLVWVSNPFIYDISVTQFGFIYHPLYCLLGGDIAALRQVNVLITFGLSWALCYAFLASLAPDFKESRVAMCVAAAGLATSSFIHIEYRMLTPSYNSLALQALLVSAIGLILAGKAAHRISSIGWMLIGVGGWLAFMAKPTTAIALVVGVFVYLLISRKYSIRMLALAVFSALALLLISVLLIDGSILRFVERLQLGVDFGKYLAGGHTLINILRVDDFQLYDFFNLVIFTISSLLFIALWSMWLSNEKWSFVGLMISFSFFVVTLVLSFEQAQLAVDFGDFKSLLIFGVVYAAVGFVLIFCGVKKLFTITASQWAIAIIFLGIPHFYAFGTNSNYWKAGGSAAIFWLLAGLTLFGPLIRERASWSFVLPLALATQAITATLLQSGFEQPYRQPQPLRLNTVISEIGPQKSQLVLSEAYSEYVASAVAIAQEAGFEPNTAVIDLSGQSPGVLYAFGAENIGQAWTIGGYPGSLKLAHASLARTSCWKIANAWILFEPEGPRSIPAELLTGLGANFPGGYKLVGSWQTAEGAGGYAYRRTQELYKPFEPQLTMSACQILRAEVAQ